MDRSGRAVADAERQKRWRRSCGGGSESGGSVLRVDSVGLPARPAPRHGRRAQLRPLGGMGRGWPSVTVESADPCAGQPADTTGRPAFQTPVRPPGYWHDFTPDRPTACRPDRPPARPTARPSARPPAKPHARPPAPPPFACIPQAACWGGLTPPPPASWPTRHPSRGQHQDTFAAYLPAYLPFMLLPPSS